MAEEEKPARSGRRIWVVILVAFLKIVYIPVLCLAALFVGLIIGYAYLGGNAAGDVMQLSTWKHLYDLVFAK